MKIPTFLPVFPGFYNTGWDLNEDNPDWLYDCCDNPNVFTDAQQSDLGELFWGNYDYSKYKKDMAKCAVDTIEEYFRDELNLPSFAIADNWTTNSPKYYNFSNDSIDCDITITKKDIKTIYKTLKEWPAFESYILERYSSRDGFMSHHTNDYKIWLDRLRHPDKLLEHGHYLGAMLDAYIEALENIEKIDHSNHLLSEYYDKFHCNISLNEYWPERLYNIFQYLVKRAERR